MLTTPLVDEAGKPANFPLWCPACHATTWYQPDLVFESFEEGTCCFAELDALRNTYQHPMNPAERWWRSFSAQAKADMEDWDDSRREKVIARSQKLERSAARARVRFAVALTSLAWFAAAGIYFIAR